MFSLALFLCFICAVSGQIKWVETGALNRCGDNLCTESEVCLRPRHYLYPFICFDVIAVPCLKSGLPLSNCYYSDYSSIADSTTILSTDSTSTATRSTSTIQSTDSTSTIQSTDSTSTIQSTDSTSTTTRAISTIQSTDSTSTTTRVTSIIQSTDSTSTTTRATSIIQSTDSNLAIHLGLNVHTALLVGGFVLLLVVIVGMAIALLCFLKKLNRLKDERQPPMEMQPVVTSFHNDAFRAVSAYELEDIPVDNQQWDTTYF